MFSYGGFSSVGEIAGGFGETVVWFRFGEIRINAGFRGFNEEEEKDKGGYNEEG